MNAWNKKRKKWLDRKSRRGNRKRNHKVTKNKALFPINQYEKITYDKASDGHSYITIKPPETFSFVYNTEETINFFGKFAKEINSKEYGKHFYIDSSEVQKVTVDALIYLIAILQNEQVNIAMGYSFAGNYPVSSEANKVYAESGFNDYVVSKMRKLPKSTDKMSIICGEDNNPLSAKQFCEFVISCLGKSRVDVQPLQKILIELMSNVYHHAYEKSPFMAKKWYMYAEHVDNYIECIFVDTGFGIAKTARKNFKEIFIELFGAKIDDVKIIRSVFMGEFRTATGEKYRGNGLSSVRENVKSPIFSKFEVISGRGKCALPINDNEEIETEIYEQPLYGTMYQFTIK